MDVSFIQPPQNKITNDRLDPPLGLMYLSAVLKQSGHNVNILDFSGGYKPDIPESDVYGFSTFTPSYNWCLDLKVHIKSKYPNARFISGGPHASALPHQCIKDWDAIIVGEGEASIKSVVDGENGVVYADMLPADDIPWPDYDIIDVPSYMRHLEGDKVLSVLSSRGCPYLCAFCNSNIIGMGKRTRYRDPYDIRDELEWLQKRYNVNVFRFLDDLFAINIRRSKEVCSVIGTLGISYRCNGKVNIFSQEMANVLRDSGCIHVSFGVESGSIKILKAMNKKQTPRNIINAITYAKNAGIKVRGYLIVGFSGETWDTVQETVDLMKQYPPDEILIFSPIPFPGTPLYNFPDEYGIKNMSVEFDDYLQIMDAGKSNYLFDHKTADRQTIQEMRQYVIEELSYINWVN
tara:strand:- start:2637 stop:3851 length:1215 start_codon:yes stop_codon:yes gene_type:complete